MATPIEKLFEEIDEKLKVTLTQKQRKAITILFNGKDVFMGTKTGSGKSMSYECVPILFEKGTTLIIASLTSIMKEQVSHLKELGFMAIYIGMEAYDIKGVKSGQYHFVFGSPTLLFGNEKWRDVIESQFFQNSYRLTFIDEAHTVVHL